MRLRMPTTAVLVWFAAIPVLLCQSKPARSAQVAQGPSSATTSKGAPEHDPPAAAKADTKESSAPSHVLFFYTAPRSTVELEAHSVPATSAARLDRLRSAFADADCGGKFMREQAVGDRHGPPGTNLICTWPGDPNGGTIVVAAHYEHEGKGEGALDDWSGAALLPFLYEAVQGQPRENTFVFLEAWRGDGVQTWLKSISHEERKQIRAMIDLDALGLGVTRYFTTFSFMETPPPAAEHLQLELLWAAIDTGATKPPLETNPHHWLSIDNTDPFRALIIPTIVIHSVPPGSEHLPGSAGDVASAIDGNAYFQSYNLICTYLASLDRMAKRLAQNDPFWQMNPNQDVRPEDETPQVTFRDFQRGHLMPAPPPAH